MHMSVGGRSALSGAGSVFLAGRSNDRYPKLWLWFNMFVALCVLSLIMIV